MKKRWPRGYWQRGFISLVETAKGYDTFLDWKRDHYCGYWLILQNPSWKKRLMNKCFKNDFRSKQPWSFRKFMHHAKQFKTKREWLEKDKSSLNYFYKMRKSGDLTKKECEKIMENITQELKYWTKEECINEARKYKRKIDWCNYSKTSHHSAITHGWYEECTKHMPYFSKADIFNLEIKVEQPLFKKIFNKKFKKTYLKIYEFNKKTVIDQNLKVKFCSVRPDFFIKNTKTKKFIFIEIKKDYCGKSKFDIKKQVDSYNKLGKSDINFKRTLLFSPNGKISGSFSFNDIKKIKI